jgi:hypothetical protein
MAEYKEYIATREPNKFIKFTIDFNKDTYHWATGQTKQKGYQLVATPVERSDMWESFTAFQGFYKIIFPVERRSKKRLEEAIQIFKQDKEKYLDYFRNQGFEIGEVN